MDAYIEVSFVHGIMTIMLSMMVGSAAAVQPVAKRRMFLYAGSISLICILLWHPWSFLWVIALEAFFFLLWFRHTGKAYLIALCVRALSFYMAFALYQGGFHNGLWFPPVHAPLWQLWLFYAITFYGLHQKWQEQLSKSSYVYQLHIYTKQEELCIQGYLDSGNLMSWKSVPVLFIDRRYEAYFREQNIQLVVRNTISKTEEIRCYECEAAIEGCSRKRVLISCESMLRLPMHCEVLLNLKMMTQG